MRIRIKRSARGGTTTADNGNGTAKTTGEHRFNQRTFLKLAGGSLGLGLAAQFLAPARVAYADQTIGSPNAILAATGTLKGPPTAVFPIEGQLQSGLTAESIQFFTFLPGQSTHTKVVVIKNTGSLDLLGHGLAAGGAAISGTLNMMGYSIIGVTDVTATGRFASSDATKYVTGGVVFILATGGNFGTDATYFFWDDGQKFLGIGTGTPGAPLDVNGHNAANGTMNVNGSMAIDVNGVAIHAYYS